MPLLGNNVAAEYALECSAAMIKSYDYRPVCADYSRVCSMKVFKLREVRPTTVYSVVY